MGAELVPGGSPRCALCGLALAAEGAACPRCAGHPDGTWAGALDPLRGEETRAPLESAFSPERRFELMETIGRGGMGVVYKVRDRELDEIVAIKVLEPLFGGSELAVERFKSEVRIARRINHPYVARLYELFLWHGRLAVSMEYIHGRSLDDVLAGGPLPIATVHRYLRYLASALDAAHRLGVVHRDLKPANILIDSQDRTHILDFGIATLAGVPNPDQPGSVFGTPYYMSPEQAFRPEIVERRSDIYSLGIVLYRMVSGAVPFASEDAQEVFHAHLSQAPMPPSALVPGLPPAFDRVILRCLEKEPSRRYGSAREMLEHLESMLEGDVPRVSGPAASRGASGLKGRVLLIDDDRFTRKVVGDHLRGLGVEVLEAKDGYEGVETAIKEQPDFVLLDLVMPVLDGRESLRILKSNPRTAGIPVVMLTGLNDAEEAMLSKEMGASVFLNKPVEPDVLELLVEKYGHGREGTRS